MMNATHLNALAFAFAALCGATLCLGCSRPLRAASAEASRAQRATTSQLKALALPELQRGRVRYALDAAETLAREWPWMTTRDTCVLLIDTEVQWGINCADAPLPDFVRLPEQLNDHPIFVRRGGSLLVNGHALSGAEFAVGEVAKVVVDALQTQVQNLAPKHVWLVISTLEALRRWHPQFGETVTEEWLTVFVHEFFHTRQLLVSGLREQLSQYGVSSVDPAPLVALYQQDPDYRALVEREHRLLVEAAEREDPTSAAARATLADWRDSYRQRRAFLANRERGELLVQMDVFFTYTEGVARYVENRFMVEASQHPAAPIPGDSAFTHFAGREGRGRAGMFTLGLGEEYYYALGFNLSSLLDQAEPCWKQRVHITPDWLIGLALASPTGRCPPMGAERDG